VPVSLVFVSASVPDPRRPGEEHFAATADNVAIRDAITALVHVVTPAATLVFGGHPAITPMVARVALALHTIDHVRIHQSAWFQPFFPEENRAFRSLVLTPRASTQQQSLDDMRRVMLDQPFDAAFFIGGMKGVLDEFEALQGRQAPPRCYPVATTGGAAAVIAERLHPALAHAGLGELFTSYDYVPLFRRLLGLTAHR
jgi:hypothetical protein